MKGSLRLRTCCTFGALCIDSDTEILNQYVLYNKNINIGNKYITSAKFQNKFGSSLKIIDIIDANGNILKIDVLNNKLQSDLNQMFYNSLVSSIPKIWKNSLKHS